MSKLKFNKKKIERIIQKSFPKANIKSYEEFSTGLVSSTFKVRISNHPKIVVAKLSKLKNKNKIHQNNKILNYLNEYKIPAPKVFFDGVIDKKFISIMEYCLGDVASNVYKNRNQNLQKNILFNAGENLRKIHQLKIPSFWIHQHHEIKNQQEWKKWTLLRVKKYLKFFSRKFNNYFDFLEKELSEFWEILKNEKIDFVPLHWDYHLSNLNVNSKGDTTGIFDFDNAMKGHSLADIGQTAYWIRFKVDDSKNFKHFLRGYKKHFTKKELKLIKGYFLLHLLAVSRTIWFKQKRLGWILDEHRQILKEFEQGKF
ncbi:MAG: aminoglycoside phosphotransferase family protein [Candidatus Woesearchaeota archaeon]